jgi:hypothetical protein
MTASLLASHSSFIQEKATKGPHQVVFVLTFDIRLQAERLGNFHVPDALRTCTKVVNDCIFHLLEAVLRLVPRSHYVTLFNRFRAFAGLLNDVNHRIVVMISRKRRWNVDSVSASQAKMNQHTSTTSIRRSPFSTFATQLCGTLSRAANWR